MIIYLFKTILCSGIIFLIYQLFLENESMHRFKRFYLLFGIAFSLTAPLIIIKTYVPVEPISQMIYSSSESLDNAIFKQANSPDSPANYFDVFLWILYVSITTFLFYRFFKNLKIFFNQIKNIEFSPYSKARLILTESKIAAHSFLKYIFINKEDFENGRIENEVLQHELTHVIQKHTIDNLIIEMILVFAWFNPFLYLYKKAIQLNHEFLADQNAVKISHDVKSYQLLLLNKARNANSLPFTSSFNYLATKKRLIMITRSTSIQVAFLKKIALIPFFALIAFVFSKNVTAQAPTIKEQQIQQDTARAVLSESTGKGVPQELINEYRDIIRKYKTDNMSWLEFRKIISDADKNKLEMIYKQMSKEQQREQTVAFLKTPSPLPKITPTKTQLEDFKKPDAYGVWINEKKVSNTTLNNYVNTDFSQVFVSKLYGAAKANVNYNYQVNLMTNAYYQKYHDEAIADKDKYIMIFQSMRKTK